MTEQSLATAQILINRNVSHAKKMANFEQRTSVLKSNFQKNFEIVSQSGSNSAHPKKHFMSTFKLGLYALESETALFQKRSCRLLLLGQKLLAITVTAIKTITQHQLR